MEEEVNKVWIDFKQHETYQEFKKEREKLWWDQFILGVSLYNPQTNKRIDPLSEEGNNILNGREYKDIKD